MMGSAALLCVASLLPAVDGIALDDSTIRTAVAAWLSDSAAAEAAYGHISTWETGGVTDMAWLFCVRQEWMDDYSSYDDCVLSTSSFNEDIGAWDTSGVTTMYMMFYEASAFDQDIGAWDISGVITMLMMFYEASAFDQDLGWCVDDGVDLRSAFSDTPCASTYCGVMWETNTGDCDMSRTGNIMVNWKIKCAVAAWLSDASATEATYGHISTWATGGVTDMSNLFYNTETFNEDIGAWDTSGVTTMDYMFYSASAFNQDIGGWAVHNVMSIEGMFASASSFNQDLGWCVDDDVDLDSWAFYNTQCASTACGILYTAALICGGHSMGDESIRVAVAAWLSNATAAEATYGHISTWETSGVTDMSQLFCGDTGYPCYGPPEAASFDEDIGAWDTSGVTSMDYMFNRASAFNRDIGGWAVQSVTDMGNMFQWASSFNQDIGDWTVDSVTSMSGMFYGASSFNQDISDWAVHSVKWISLMFHSASAFDQDLGWCVDDEGWVPFKASGCALTLCGVKWGDCEFPPTGNVMVNWKIKWAVGAWLSDATAAEAMYGHISTWETSGVTDMSYLFEDASSFNADIGAWDTSGVTDMSHMFEEASAFNRDIGAWDTSGVTTMYGMFWGASSFNQDIGDWAVHSVRDMRYMFRGSYSWVKSSFNQDISGWAVHSVTSMALMFYDASVFNQDIGDWAVDSVDSMESMFNGASAFNQDIGDWPVHSVRSMDSMFLDASAFDQNLGWCVGNGVDLEYAFDNTLCESTSCGVTQVAGGCAPSPAPLPAPTTTRAPTTTHAPTPWPTVTPGTSSSSGGGGGGSTAVIAGAATAVVLLLAVGAFCFYRRRKASMINKADEPSSANPEPTELPPLDEATLSKEEEATVPVAPEGEEASTEQLPPPPPRRWFSRAEPEPEPAAPKAEEMYNQIAAWYNEPENAMLRTRWGAFPGPGEFQTWPGFVAVTNAYLDREAG